jgi:hypothetical protein
MLRERGAGWTFHCFSKSFTEPSSNSVSNPGSGLLSENAVVSVLGLQYNYDPTDGRTERTKRLHKIGCISSDHLVDDLDT